MEINNIPVLILVISLLSQLLCIQSLSINEILQQPLNELLTTLQKSPSIKSKEVETIIIDAYQSCKRIDKTRVSINTKQNDDSMHTEYRINIATEEHSSIERYCNRVKYLYQKCKTYKEIQREIKEIINKNKEENVDFTYQNESKSPEVTIQNIQNIDYQAFFETFAVPNAPVFLHDVKPLSKLLLEGVSNDETDNKHLDQFFQACFLHSNALIDEMALEDRPCMDRLEQFKVPIYISQNYLYRVPSAAAFAKILRPSVVTIQNSVIPTCPFGFHSYFLMLNVTIPLDVELLIYPRRYEPLLWDLEGNMQNEIMVNAFEGIETESMTFESVKKRELIQPSYRITLPQDYLYSNQTSIIYLPGPYSARTTHSFTSLEYLKALRFCTIDASNLNAVKEELRIEALEVPLAQTLVSEFQSANFSTVMMRRPSSHDLLWPNYIRWPRITSRQHRKGVMFSQSHESARTHPTETSAAANLSRRERLKIWQDDKRWEKMITGLTLPITLPPIIIAVKRNAATLKWQDIYAPIKGDTTDFGYEIQYQSEEYHVETPKDIGSLLITRANFRKSVMPTTLFGDDFDGKDIQTTVQSLLPNTAYTFSVRLLVGNDISDWFAEQSKENVFSEGDVPENRQVAWGLPSARSQVVTTENNCIPSIVRGIPRVVNETNALLTCIDMEFLPPIDNGGTDLLFLAYKIKEIDDPLGAIVTDHHEQRSFNGPGTETRGHYVSQIVNRIPYIPTDSKLSLFKTIQLCNFIPQKLYHVSLAVENEVGRSKWSHYSLPFQLNHNNYTRNVDYIPTIKGAQGSDGNLASSVIQDQGVPMLLSDITQQIVVNSTRYDVWAGHYSPKAFHISSTYIAAIPFSGASPLQNSQAAQNRIVLMSRGDVPLVYKVYHAQAAGALGVIIADFNDSCHGQFNEHCLPGADKSRGEGFGQTDRHELWDKNQIPCVFALYEVSNILLSLLHPPDLSTPSLY